MNCNGRLKHSSFAIAAGQTTRSAATSMRFTTAYRQASCTDVFLPSVSLTVDAIAQPARNTVPITPGRVVVLNGENNIHNTTSSADSHENFGLVTLSTERLQDPDLLIVPTIGLPVEAASASLRTSVGPRSRWSRHRLIQGKQRSPTRMEMI